MSIASVAATPLAEIARAVDFELAWAWVARLRAGVDRQGSAALERAYADGTVARCCLGVACRVAEFPAEVLPGPRRSGSGIVKFGTAGDCDAAFLPESLAARLGLGVEGERRDGEPWRFGAESYNELATANDAGVRFPEIGDALAGYYDRLAAVLAADGGAS